MFSRELCEVCGKQAYFACSQCEQAFYCSQEHQVEHWRIHRDHCIIFKDHKLNAIENKISVKRMDLRAKYFQNFMHKMYDQCIKIANEMVLLQKNHIEDTRQILNELQYGISISLLAKSKLIIKNQIQALIILKSYLNEKMHFLEDLKDIYSLEQPHKYDNKSKEFSCKKISLLAALANISYSVKQPITMDLYHIYTDHVIKVYGAESVEVSNCYFMVGTYYYEHKSLHKAIACFLKAAKLRGNRAEDCYYNLGIIFFLMKKEKVAIQMFENAKLSVMSREYGENSSEIADIYRNLALIYQSIGNYPQAIQNFSKISMIYAKDKNSPAYKGVQEDIRKLQKQMKDILESKNENLSKMGLVGDLKKILQDKMRKGSKDEEKPADRGLGQNPKNKDTTGPKLKVPEEFLKKLNPLELFHLSELQLEIEEYKTEYMVASALGSSKFFKVLGVARIDQFKNNNAPLFKQISLQNLNRDTTKNNHDDAMV